MFDADHAGVAQLGERAADRFHGQPQVIRNISTAHVQAQRPIVVDAIGRLVQQGQQEDRDAFLGRQPAKRQHLSLSGGDFALQLQDHRLGQ